MSVCARCGASFGCAMADPGNDHPCWCTGLPAAVPVPAPDAPGSGCWCPACLRQHIEAAAAATAAAATKPAAS